jgi:hypothetical protein
MTIFARHEARPAGDVHQGSATSRVEAGSRPHCSALTRDSLACNAPWQLVGDDGLCPAHARRVDVVMLGRAGGLASGAARRALARRVRGQVENARVEACVDRAQEELRELQLEQRESRRRFHQDLIDRRTKFIAAVRAELREKLREERAELRRLRRRRKQFEAL